MTKITKVQAVANILKRQGGKAHWSVIYAEMNKEWKGAKAGTEIGKAGVRGVVNREISRGRHFKFVDKGSGVIALR